MQIKINISNLDCKKCVDRLKKSLEKNPIGQLVEVDLDSKQVVFLGDKKEVTDGLEDLGYEFTVLEVIE